MRDHRRGVRDRDGDADRRAGRLAARLPAQRPRPADVQPDDGRHPRAARLRHPAHRHVHAVRRQDTQPAGELQRGEVHRLHDVHDVRHLGGVRAALLRQRHEGGRERGRGRSKESGAVCMKHQ